MAVMKFIARRMPLIMIQSGIMQL